MLSLPEEGGLQYLTNLVALAAAKAQAGPIRFNMAGVEVYHLAKQGKSVALLATGRVPAQRKLVEQYEVIRGRYRNLLFRGQLIRNLLDGQPWYHGFDRLFAVRDQETFIGQVATAFAVDVDRKFNTEFAASSVGGDTMYDTAPTTFDLSKRVHDMVAQYVYHRTESKSGIKWADFKDRRITDPATGKTRIDVPPKYREARERVCQDAFLSLRACRSREDFVAYFTGTICAVPQYLPIEEYQALADALLGDDGNWERVKALSMLTLSALSRV